MLDFLTSLIAWLVMTADSIGSVLFGWIAIVPGWLSNTIIASITGVLMLLVFKYTSNQDAIGRVRDRIKANMLALKLYKDSLYVTFKSLGGLFAGAGSLLLHALRPMGVMIVPMVLLLGQLALWYEHRPLAIGEEAIVSVQVQETQARPSVRLIEAEGVEVVVDRSWFEKKNAYYWKVRATEPGEYDMLFDVDGFDVEKKLVVGEGLAKVNVKRAGWDMSDMLMFPGEISFAESSVVQGISIEYPQREGIAGGAFWWMVWFFGVSMIAALIFKPVFGVKI
ncbi:hypothetical protein STSP2_01521 [Anaerohalosphaera lusitana]|uniref:Uncharacterized protein n=1 Tax=Anaerohalosphaera lusitana TaxID=1936003 RepID=A0A1U9NKB5_9BACT|nr:hypothetical protein [Anaerohalosphaera lusitana]AQT68361.1 hypothetical protein STSP2_01521 [Anaerohalosphaera lusitana]